MLFQRSLLVFTLIASLSFSIFAQASPSASPRQEKLLNGLRVLMWNDPSSPRVNVRLRIHAGAAFDPQEKEGVMMLLSESIFPSQDARDFFTEDLQGELKIETHYDYIEINASAKADAYLTLIETISNAVTNPVFDKAVTDAVKARVLPKAEANEKTASNAADLAVRKRLFQTFPYGRPVEGTTESLKKIDFADLRFAYDRLFGADNATLAISGNFPLDYGYRAVRRFFGSWLKSDKKVPSTFRQPDAPPAGTQVVASPETGVTEIRYALRGVARNDKDYAATKILAHIFESRLKMKAPIDQRAGVFVRNYSNVLPGVVIFAFSGIRNDMSASVTSDRPRSEANDIVAGILADHITDAEFTLGKVAAAESFNKVDTQQRWLNADTFKLANVKADYDAFTAVSREDVQRVADRLKQQPVASVLLLSQRTAN